MLGSRRALLCCFGLNNIFVEYELLTVPNCPRIVFEAFRGVFLKRFADKYSDYILCLLTDGKILYVESDFADFSGLDKKVVIWKLIPEGGEKIKFLKFLG